MPGFAFNHFEWVFGIETNRFTASDFRFLGHSETYHFNALIGVFYNPTPDGLHLGLGWHAGFLGVSNNTPSGAIPFSIHGATLRLQANSSWLGNPASFQWAVGVGIDPVPAPKEGWRTTLLVCYVPNQGTVAWP
jgi:hypothetical protein